MTNRERFIKCFGYDGSIVSRCHPGDYGQIVACGYPTCSDSCASRNFPRCPHWWDDNIDNDFYLMNQNMTTSKRSDI